MRRAASETLCRALAIVLVGVLTLGAWAQPATTLPAGIQGASSLDGSQRDQLKQFIDANYKVMESGTIAQQRASRDALLDMFDAPAVSTAFRQAAAESLAPMLDAGMKNQVRWNRFAALRIAAKLATEDSARIFMDAIDANAAPAESDLLMALGQVRVMFLEVDVGGLAMSVNSLNRLSGRVGEGLAEAESPDVALMQARALRALSQSQRSEAAFDGVRGAAMSALSNAVAARLKGGGLNPVGADPRDNDALLVSLEALDAARGYLVLRNPSKPLEADTARALGQLSGQAFAFVTRTYEQTPANADTSRRYLQRIAQLAGDVGTIVVEDHNLHHPSDQVATTGLPTAANLASSLAGRKFQQFKLDVIKYIEALGQAFGFPQGWAPIN